MIGEAFQAGFGKRRASACRTGPQGPSWRLGALVSLLSSNGKGIMVERPDRSLSLKPRWPHAPRRENVSRLIRLCERVIRSNPEALLRSPAVMVRTQSGLA